LPVLRELRPHLTSGSLNVIYAEGIPRGCGLPAPTLIMPALAWPAGGSWRQLSAAAN
jgi:hypothetical protein